MGCDWIYYFFPQYVDSVDTFWQGNYMYSYNSIKTIRKKGAALRARWMLRAIRLRLKAVLRHWELRLKMLLLWWRATLMPMVL